MSGATLALTLWPEDSSDIDVGDTVETLDVAQVKADDAGRYAIEVDPDELSSQYFNGEYLNFDISITVDDQFGTWSSTVWLAREEYWRSDERALVGDAALDISFDLAGPTIVLTDSYGETERQDLPLFGGPGTP